MLEIIGPLMVALVAQQVSQSSPAAQPASAASQPETHGPSGFLYRRVAYENREYPYCVFVPPAYTPERAWPVILFMHGSGEGGDDGFLQTDVGLGRALRRYYRMIPAIVVMPQAPMGTPWVGPMSRMALRCVEDVSRDYHLDPNRVYLTGLSLGGMGAWALAAELPDRFAAVAPLCGSGDPKTAAKLKDVPIWAFHGGADTAVPVEGSRAMVQAIRAAGGTLIKYSEVEKAGHNVWDQAYSDAEFWKWMFAQKRP
ncbi:MAG: alpha/beta hydrolase-fold protein [Phycisphaerae bacterium]